MINKKLFFAFCLSMIMAMGLLSFKLIKNDNSVKSHETVSAGLTLPEGFQAAIIADDLGSARHLVATPQGDIYIHLARAKNGKGILVFHVDGDKATLKSSFADFGGTGIAIKMVICMHPTAGKFIAISWMTKMKLSTRINRKELLKV